MSTHLVRRRPLVLFATSTALPTSTAAGGGAGRVGTGAATAQTRSARLVGRKHRPYQFTQLVQLSDGSTYTARTTSPVALYRSAKDSRNHMLWQPSLRSLRNVEVDEAGKLAAFRGRFGRGWDMAKPAAAAVPEARPTTPAADAAATETPPPAEAAAAAAAPPVEAESSDMLDDLISAYSARDPEKTAKEKPKEAGKGRKR